MGVQLCPTIRQSVKANTDAKVLKAKLALNWTGRYKDPDCRPLLRRRDPGRLATWEQPVLFGPPFRPARFGRSSACGD